MSTKELAYSMIDNLTEEQLNAEMAKFLEVSKLAMQIRHKSKNLI